MAKPSRRRRYSSQVPTYHKLTNHQQGEHNSLLKQLLGILGREESPPNKGVEDRNRVPRRHRGRN